MPNCVIVALFYIFRTMPLLFVAVNCSLVTLENKMFNMWIGIIFPSLPVSISVLVLYYFDLKAF